MIEVPGVIPICPKCGAIEFYTLKNGYLKCKKCRRINSGTNGTYLDNLKIPLEKLELFVKIVCENPAISVRAICEQVGIASNTANIKKRIIVSAMLDLKSRDSEAIIKRLFTNIEFDDKPMELIGTGTLKSLTDDQVRLIRELRKNKVKGPKIAEMFGIDQSNVYKIEKRKIYKTVI